MGVHVTSAGKVKVSLALDPHAYELLKQMSGGPRALGALLDDLIQAEAARRAAGPAPVQPAAGPAGGRWDSDIAKDNARLYAEVQERQRQLQNLSRRLVEVQEEERRALSRELHDEAGQALTALKLGLGLLQREADCTPTMQGKIVELRAIADEVADSLHRLALNLRPSSLDRYGLVPALEGYVAVFQKQAGVEVQFLASGHQDNRLPTSLETALYRIAQEALTNVARHARAAHVDVLLQRHADRVTLIVEDDGIGFDMDEALQRGRLGLLGMRERAEMLGGSLTIESEPGRTVLYVNLPVSPTDEAAAVDLDEPAASGALAGELPVRPAAILAEAELARAKALGDALNDWHNEIAGVHDPDLILQRVVIRAGEVLGSEVATVAVRDGADWVLRGGYRLNPIFAGRRYTQADIPQYLAYAAATGQVLVINDAASDTRFAPAEAGKFGLSAVLAVPFTLDGEVLGCLGFNEYGGPRYYTPAEVEFAHRLKTSVSLALENARLRQAEGRQRDELARRLQELEALLELLPMGVAIARDAVGQDIRVNAALAQMLGTPPGMNVSLSAGEGDREAHYQVFDQDGWELSPEELPVQRAGAGIVVRDTVLDVRREDGSWVTLLSSAVPLRAGDGTVRGAVASFTDITERRAAEAERERLLEEIRDQHELLEQIMAASPVAMCVLRGQEHACRLANPAFAALAGVSSEQWLGRPLGDVFPALQAAAYPLIAQVYATGRAVRLPEELYIRGPQRQESYWDLAFVPLRGQGDEVAGILMVAGQVTEQVQARLQIAELAHEARRQADELDAVLAAIADGLVIFDANGTAGRANHAAQRMLGYALKEEPAGVEEGPGRVQWLRANGEPYRPEDFPAARALRGETVQGSIMALRRPGETIWVSASAGPILGSGGALQGAVATFTDITRLHDTQKQLEETYQELELTTEELQRQAEELAELNRQLADALERVHRSEATYRAIARCFPSGAVVVVDPDLRYLVADGEALASMGLSGKTMIGKTLREVLAPEMAEELASRYRATLLGESLRHETTHAARSFAVEYRPIRDEHDRVIAALAVSLDITERVALERQLRKANDRLQAQAAELSQREAALRAAAETLEQRVQERTAGLEAANARLIQREATLQYQAMLLENVGDAIIGLDAGLNIVTWNRAAEEYYGWQASDVIGRHLTEITHSDLAPEARAAAMRALAELGHWRGESLHLRRDGTPFWVEGAVIALRDGSGAITGYAAVNRDTTKRREAEEAVRLQKERLETLHQQLDAGREQLKALARRLVGVQERERRYVADQLYNEAGQVLAALRMHLNRSAGGEAGQSYLTETQYLLDRVMLDLHHLATGLRPATLDRLGLVHALQQYATEWGREHNVEVQFEALGPEGARPDGDTETALYRIVQEALMNVALHAHARSVAIAVSSVGGRLAVTIEDDGVGFDSAKAIAQGALGLLGMRERAEAIGGRLAIESAPGQGTAVYIEVT